MTPLLQKIEKQRADIAALGDKLIRLGEDRDLANQQVITAGQKVSDAQTALIKAEQDVAAAAAAAMRDQAALPPGTPRLRARRPRRARPDAARRVGDRGGRPRHLAIIRAAQTSALAEQATATTNATEFAQQYDKLNADITKRQAALQKLEQKHADEITAGRGRAERGGPRAGRGYLDGASQGRGADPRAIAALTFALAQRGDPYVWSEEGPDQYDCSGLMYAAYRSPAAGSFPLARVSRDQYYQTRNKRRGPLLAGPR